MPHARASLVCRGAIAVGFGALLACANAGRPPRAASTELAVGAAAEPVDIARAATWVYRTPPPCPSEREFLDQLDRRLPPLTASDVSSRVGPRVDVEVRNTDADWFGSVRFEGAEGAVSREVTGTSCEEVVVALALITSLWLRPDGAPVPTAATTLAAAPSASVVRARDESPAELSVAAAPVASTPAEPTSAAAPSAESFSAAAPSDATTPDDRPAPPPVATADPTPARYELAALLGYASEPAGALSARLQLERWGSASVSSWSSALALGYAEGAHENDRLGPATLRLLHAQLALCPPGLELVGDAWLRACAHGRAGGLRFSPDSDRLPDARSRWRPWAAAGAGLAVGVAVSEHFSLRLLTELSIVLSRDEFATERPLPAPSGAPAGTTFYEISPVSFDVGLGAAHVF
ncbi:MAG TPA: hypothetical protein VMG12_37585 [Polyangiaceae bacterium]|nr:hypothetical protein [Polyangiaceae bacterium]